MTAAPSVEPDQVWLDTTARIDGQKPSPSMRRIVRVLRVLTSGLGEVECSGTWQTRSPAGTWNNLSGQRVSRVQLAHWHRRMTIISEPEEL